MTLDNNLKLAENAVLSVEESLSKVFQERSNQVFQKLENILTIFKEEKVSTSHFNQSSGSGHRKFVVLFILLILTVYVLLITVMGSLLKIVNQFLKGQI